MRAKTVLIVDDEMSNTQLFGMMLELEGYRPVAAFDARARRSRRCGGSGRM